MPADKPSTHARPKLTVVQGGVHAADIPEPPSRWADPSKQVRGVGAKTKETHKRWKTQEEVRVAQARRARARREGGTPEMPADLVEIREQERAKMRASQARAQQRSEGQPEPVLHPRHYEDAHPDVMVRAVRECEEAALLRDLWQWERTGPGRGSDRRLAIGVLEHLLYGKGKPCLRDSYADLARARLQLTEWAYGDPAFREDGKVTGQSTVYDAITGRKIDAEHRRPGILDEVDPEICNRLMARAAWKIKEARQDEEMFTVLAIDGTDIPAPREQVKGTSPEHEALLRGRFHDATFGAKSQRGFLRGCNAVTLIENLSGKPVRVALVPITTKETSPVTAMLDRFFQDVPEAVGCVRFLVGDSAYFTKELCYDLVMRYGIHPVMPWNKTLTEKGTAHAGNRGVPQCFCAANEKAALEADAQAPADHADPQAEQGDAGSGDEAGAPDAGTAEDEGAVGFTCSEEEHLAAAGAYDMRYFKAEFLEGPKRAAKGLKPGDDLATVPWPKEKGKRPLPRITYQCPRCKSRTELRVAEAPHVYTWLPFKDVHQVNGPRDRYRTRTHLLAHRNRSEAVFGAFKAWGAGLDRNGKSRLMNSDRAAKWITYGRFLSYTLRAKAHAVGLFDKARAEAEGLGLTVPEAVQAAQVAGEAEVGTGQEAA